MDPFDILHPDQLFANEILQAVAREVEREEVELFTESGVDWVRPAPLLFLGNDSDDPERHYPNNRV